MGLRGVPPRLKLRWKSWRVESHPYRPGYTYIAAEDTEIAGSVEHPAEGAAIDIPVEFEYNDVQREQITDRRDCLWEHHIITRRKERLPARC